MIKMGNKLYRSKEQKKVCGVCSGLAAYFGIDPTIIRVLWVVLTVINFVVGILVYFLCVFIIPMEPDYIEAEFKEKK